MANNYGSKVGAELLDDMMKTYVGGYNTTITESLVPESFAPPVGDGKVTLGRGTVSAGFTTNDIYQEVKKYFPKITEVKISHKVNSRTYTLRIQYSNIYYETQIAEELLANSINPKEQLIGTIRQFISESIERDKPAKKERTKMSKKQRELKKAWML